MKYFKLLLLALILSPIFLYAQEVGSLKVVIDGFTNDEGCARIALANSEENYAENVDIYRGASAKINDQQAVYIFEDIPYGEYAVKVFHDENDNGNLDTNFLGIPSEDYGFSNNAKGTFGPPSWSAARFSFETKNDSIFISVE
jgi:uncharacterized protein (DUF2141 family)